jgi:hypothetical protein
MTQPADGAQPHDPETPDRILRRFGIEVLDENPAAPTLLRIGRGTAVSDAQAVDDDGKVALTARVTAHR